MNWNCNNVNTYVDKLREMIAKFDDSKAKYAKRKPSSFRTCSFYSAAFNKFPKVIAIKNGYEPISQYANVDANHYSFWMRNTLSDDDTIIWYATMWHDFDVAAACADWHDISKILKDLDIKCLWSQYDPFDESLIKNLPNDPTKFFLYLKSDSRFKPYRLCADEQKEITEFYSSDAQREALAKAFKRLHNKIYAARPSVKSAIEANLNYLFGDGASRHIEFLKANGDDCGDAKKILGSDSVDTNYYSGSNFKNEKGTAMRGIITKALNNMFPDNEKMLDALNYGVDVKVFELGVGDTDNSSVSSSSFWTFYRYNYRVEITCRNETYSEIFKNVIVSSSYYSGGW